MKKHISPFDCVYSLDSVANARNTITQSARECVQFEPHLAMQPTQPHMCIYIHHISINVPIAIATTKHIDARAIILPHSTLGAHIICKYTNRRPQHTTASRTICFFAGTPRYI